MKLQMKEKWKKSELILGAVAAVQILFLIIFNLMHIKYIVNFDSGAYFALIREIVRQGTLFVENYYYTTQLLWDSPLFLVVLLYKLTGNMFFSAGLANAILILCFAAVLWKLTKDLELSRGARFLVQLCVFTTYQFGYVDYMEELFVNAAWYGVRILLQLLLLDLVICLHKKSFRRTEKILLVILLAGFFVSGISTGIFSIGCIILPVLGYEVILMLAESRDTFCIKSIFKPCIMLPFVALVVALTGVVIYKKLGFMASTAMEKNTIAIEKAGENFVSYILGYFQFMGWPGESVPLISVAGILAIMEFILAVSLIIVAVICLIRFVKEVITEKYGVAHFYIGHMIFLLLVNLLLFMLADLHYSEAICEYRYWVIVVVPGMVLVGIVYDQAVKCKRFKVLYQVTALALLLCMVMVNAVQDRRMWRYDNDADDYQELMEIAEEENADAVIGYMNFLASKTMVAFASGDMEAIAASYDGVGDDGRGLMWTPYPRIQKWGAYVNYGGDVLDVDEDIRLAIVFNGTYPQEEEMIISRSSADKVRTTADGKYRIVIMDQNYADFQFGIPAVGKAVSRDYLSVFYDISRMTLNAEGYYVSDEGEGRILSGDFKAETDFRGAVKLKGEIVGNAVLAVEVTGEDGSVKTYRQMNTEEKTEIVLEDVTIPAGADYTVYVEQDRASKVVLDYIEYVIVSSDV